MSKLNVRTKDLTGKPFGTLIVLGMAGYDKNGKALCLVKCNCGHKSCKGEFEVLANSLKRGKTTSCGAWLETEDLTGKPFGTLIVLGMAGHDKYRSPLCLVKCNCGHKSCKGELKVLAKNLKNGNTTSCGAWQETEDLTGKPFGTLIVLGMAGYDKRHKALCNVKCNCGHKSCKGEFEVLVISLKNGNTTSCGAWLETEDLTGKPFGTLIVLGMAGYDKHHQALCNVKCNCGHKSCKGELKVLANNLKRGNTTNCGAWRETEDLTGKPFGTLIVLGFVGYKNGNASWTAKCNCGHKSCKGEFEVLANSLKCGNTTSCGAWQETEDLTGKPFGTLIVLGFVGYKNGNASWTVKCNCGHKSCKGEFEVLATNLKQGYTKSCGSGYAVREKFFRKFINENSTVQWKKERPTHLYYPKGRSNLEYDFWNRSAKVAFEYQGEHHLKFPNYYHETRNEFEELQRKDRYKVEMSKLHRIRLYHLYYYRTDKQIEDFIIDRLKHHGLLR